MQDMCCWPSVRHSATHPAFGSTRCNDAACDVCNNGNKCNRSTLMQCNICHFTYLQSTHYRIRWQVTEGRVSKSGLGIIWLYASVFSDQLAELYSGTWCLLSNRTPYLRRLEELQAPLGHWPRFHLWFVDVFIVRTSIYLHHITVTRWHSSMLFQLITLQLFPSSFPNSLIV